MGQQVNIEWLMVTLKKKLMEGETYTDSQILDALMETQQRILNYCVIPVVPYALRFDWINASLDLLRTQFPSEEAGGGGGGIIGGDAEITGIVKEITTGDTTVKFDADTGGTNGNVGGYTHKPLMDEVFYNYLENWRPFRRIF